MVKPSVGSSSFAPSAVRSWNPSISRSVRGMGDTKPRAPVSPDPPPLRTPWSRPTKLITWSVFVSELCTSGPMIMYMNT